MQPRPLGVFEVAVCNNSLYIKGKCMVERDVCRLLRGQIKTKYNFEEQSY